MVDYMVGKITYKNDYYILLESNFKGYKIFVSDSNKFDSDNLSKIFTYVKVYQNNKNTFVYEYYGFKTLKEKIFFETLLSVTGIGPKTALIILKNNLDVLKELIRNEDVSSLSALEGFNQKNSLAIISALSFKMKNERINGENYMHGEKPEEVVRDENGYNATADLISALKALGYKKNVIEKALSHLIKDVTTTKQDGLNDLISKAIKVILNETVAS